MTFAGNWRKALSKLRSLMIGMHCYNCVARFHPCRFVIVLRDSVVLCVFAFRWICGHLCAVCRCANCRKTKQLNEEYHVTDRVVKTARTGVQKAKELNAQYDITGHVSSAVTTGAQKAKQLAQEYQVVERTKALTQAGISKAKDINERHHVTDKLGTIATGVLVKAQQLDSEYKVTERASTLLMAALNSATSAAQRVIDTQAARTNSTTSTTVAEKRSD